MTIKQVKSFWDWPRLVCIVPLAMLWSVPIWRALKFLIYAQGIYSEDRSINAGNDVRYAAFLFFSYMFCLLIQIALCLVLARTRFLVLVVLLAFPIWRLIQIIQFRPEEVIVLVPAMNPLSLLVWNTPVLLALFFCSLRWTQSFDHGICRAT